MKNTWTTLLVMAAICSFPLLGCEDNSSQQQAEDCTENGCKDGKLYTCENGKVVFGESCDSNKCADDGKTCAPKEDVTVECTENGCKDGKLYTCENGQIVFGEPCESNKCTDDGKICAPKEDITVECTENGCKDGKLYTCDNGKIVIGESCDSNKCADDGKTCAPKEDVTVECTENGCKDGKPYTCENGQIVLGDKCKFGCLADNTACRECKDGDTKCENNDKKLGITYTCVDGLWEEGDKCDRVSCAIDELMETSACGECLNQDNPVCVNGTGKVGSIQQCINGKVEIIQTCKGEYNKDASCNTEDLTNLEAATECGECVSGTKKCQMDISKDLVNGQFVETSKARRYDCFDGVWKRTLWCRKQVCSTTYTDSCFCQTVDDVSCKPYDEIPDKDKDKL